VAVEVVSEFNFTVVWLPDAPTVMFSVWTPFSTPEMTQLSAPGEFQDST
jgi:hypothetical protein